MKMIDLPPVWLALHLGAAWAIAQLVPIPLPGVGALGWVLIALGLGLMIAAATAMARARTTIIPHRQPTALVTGGIFGISRNPIYLGDAMILAGACLVMEAPLALILVPVFVVIITRRFIAPEEARLRAGFGPAFEAWAARTGRWL